MTAEADDNQRARGAAADAPWRGALLCFGVAIAAATLAILDFAPRLAYWPGLNYAMAREVSEYGRAKVTIAQVEDPWAPITAPMHKVLAWRLLLPLVWHYLHLPPQLLLAVPHLGCLVTLWLVAWLTQRRMANWPLAILVTLLFAALPWFFVSTGWLGYFDSWLVLGLLAAAFLPSRMALALACLLTPWIDERFVIALPATMMVRAAALRRVENHEGRAVCRDLAVVFAASLPFAAIRAVVWLRGDPDSTIYVHAHWLSVFQISWQRYLAGFWSGYRAGWVVVGAALWLLPKRVGRRWGAAFALVVLGTAVGGLFIAADMSRSLMMICPVLLLGAWLGYASRPAIFHWLLPLVVAANYLLPAAHEIWFMTVGISHMGTEFQRLRGPVPEILAAATRIEDALALINQGKFDEARGKLDEALELDPFSTTAYVNRAKLKLAGQDFGGAMADAEAALRINPMTPAALYIRGCLRAARGERAPAVDDIRNSLYLAGPTWNLRPQAEQVLKQLTEPARPEDRRADP